MSQDQTTVIDDLEWYHPYASRHVAESLLMLNGEDGTYLLRPCHKSGSFALSVRGQDSVKHYTVSCNGGEYQFGLSTFSSLDEFISHLASQPLLGGESGVVTLLKYPYPRTVDEPEDYEKIRIHAQMGHPASVRCSTRLALGSKEGYLTKRGGFVKNWKRRWFVLNRMELRYYRERSDPTPLRIIDLNECTECIVDNIDGRTNVFRLVLPWRVFYLCASTPVEAKEWIDVIQWKLERISRTTNHQRHSMHI